MDGLHHTKKMTENFFGFLSFCGVFLRRGRLVCGGTPLDRGRTLEDGDRLKVMGLGKHIQQMDGL